MNCHVVLDKKNNVVSVGYLDSPEVRGFDPPRFGPVADADQRVVDMDLPDDCAELSIPQFLERLNTEVKAHLALQD